MIPDMKPLGPWALRGFPLRSHNGNALISPERPSHKGRVFMFASLPHIQPPGRADTRGGGAVSLCGIYRRSHEVRAPAGEASSSVP